MEGQQGGSKVFEGTQVALIFLLLLVSTVGTGQSQMKTNKTHNLGLSLKKSLQNRKKKQNLILTPRYLYEFYALQMKIQTQIFTIKKINQAWFK